MQNQTAEKKNLEIFQGPVAGKFEKSTRVEKRPSWATRLFDHCSTGAEKSFNNTLNTLKAIYSLADHVGKLATLDHSALKVENERVKKIGAAALDVFKSGANLQTTATQILLESKTERKERIARLRIQLSGLADDFKEFKRTAVQEFQKLKDDPTVLAEYTVQTLLDVMTAVSLSWGAGVAKAALIEKLTTTTLSEAAEKAALTQVAEASAVPSPTGLNKTETLDSIFGEEKTASKSLENLVEEKALTNFQKAGFHSQQELDQYISAMKKKGYFGDSEIGDTFNQHVIKGPIPDRDAQSFVGQRYTAVKVKAKTKLYRIDSVLKDETDEGVIWGSYWTRTPPEGLIQSRIDNALPDAWNKKEMVYVVEVPEGEVWTVYEGETAPQVGNLESGSPSSIEQRLKTGGEPDSARISNVHMGGHEQVYITRDVRASPRFKVDSISEFKK